MATSSDKPRKPANLRLKLLKAVGRQTHRYDWLRRLAQLFTLAVLVMVPLSGLARVDACGGEHRLLFKAVPFKHALAGVIVGIVAMYVITFLSNVAAGRLFCGWGCPVGEVSRLGERLDTPGLSRRQRWQATILGAVYSGLFVISILAWWVDLRVLAFGGYPAAVVAWSLVAVGTAGAYLHGRYWQWAFCKKVCPIGMYYSVVSPARYFGIHFRNQQQSCIECDACDHICPVQLHPRELAAPMQDDRGLNALGAPGHNHCLECGDCVRACEFMIDTRGKGPVPLLLGYYDGPQRGDGVDASEKDGHNQSALATEAASADT